MKWESATKKEMIEWLQAHDYDGLYGDDNCGCTLDDLISCGEIGLLCKPGYLVLCVGCDEYDGCIAATPGAPCPNYCEEDGL